MPVKKAKKPSHSIRYLLSADRKLQKISLRKMSGGANKAKPAARSRRSTKAVPPRQPLVPPLAISPRAIVLSLTGLLVAAALLAARQPLPRIVDRTQDISSTRPASSTPQEASIPATRASLLAVPELKSAAAVKAPAAPQQVAISDAPSATVPTSRATTARPVTRPRQTMTTEVRTDARTEPRTPPKMEPTPETRPETKPETKPAGNDQDVALTTVTGCLVSDGDGFRLKDASGSDVPKSRSWKSGFLRKKSVGIAIVDPARTLHLTNYVGQRVATTGTLVDREMRARSLTRMASSCD